MKETVGPARNGLDVEMPGPGEWWGDGRLARAVESGEVDESFVDEKVRRVLAFLAWRGRSPGETTTEDERSVDRPEHRTLVRRAAAAGTVLLKNDGLLPLAPGRSVAIIGPGAVATALLGGGSASLTPHPSPTVAEAMAARYDGPVAVAEGINLRRVAPSVPPAWIGPEGVVAELFDGPEFAGTPFRVDRCTRGLPATARRGSASARSECACQWWRRPVVASGSWARRRTAGDCSSTASRWQRTTTGSRSCSV
jgi:beta-glucosidase